MSFLLVSDPTCCGLVFLPCCVLWLGVCLVYLEVIREELRLGLFVYWPLLVPVVSAQLAAEVVQAPELWLAVNCSWYTAHVHYF